MASQAPFFSTLIPIINNKNHTFSPKHTKFKNSIIQFSKTQENEPEPNNQEQDPIKLAFAKAKSYKNTLKSNTEPKRNNLEIPVEESIENEPTVVDDSKEIPLAVKLAMEKAKEYKKNTVKEINVKNDELKSDEVIENDVVKKEMPLAMKIAMEKANEYKKNKGVAGNEVTSSNIAKESIEVSLKNENEVVEKEVPLAMKIALEKAKEYKKNKGVVGVSETSVTGVKGENERTYEVEESAKKEGSSISSIDFVGLNFSDKKTGRGLPAGLAPLSDPFPEGDLPEVEIVVGDKSNFGNTEELSDKISIKENDLDDDLYKPKVTTWGLFPRPNDISKAYGGGRTIRPGEALETAEEKAAKDAKTKKLLIAYKKKFGLNIDPKLKSECEQVLNDGDSLMDLGRLKEALPFYEKVMENLPLQSELHGLAALQWSICVDSLNRSNEARVMYEKLQSHPVPKVSKRARQFVFGFQAMEMMKVTTSPRPNPFIGYQNYFDAFVKDKMDFTPKDAETDETGLSQTLPYVVFLLSPILMVFLIAAFRSR